MFSSPQSVPVFDLIVFIMIVITNAKFFLLWIYLMARAAESQFTFARKLATILSLLLNRKDGMIQDLQTPKALRGPKRSRHSPNKKVKKLIKKKKKVPKEQKKYEIILGKHERLNVFLDNEMEPNVTPPTLVKQASSNIKEPGSALKSSGIKKVRLDSQKSARKSKPSLSTKVYKEEKYEADR